MRENVKVMPPGVEPPYCCRLPQDRRDRAAFPKRQAEAFERTEGLCQVFEDETEVYMVKSSVA